MSFYADAVIGSPVDLPTDVLALIVFNLEPRDYLAFAQVTKAIYAEYRQEPTYWRTQTANKFRLPISPLLAADGPRWYWLYKRLKTQTRLYTWGQGLRGNLGLGRSLSVPRRRLGIAFRGPPPDGTQPSLVDLQISPLSNPAALPYGPAHQFPRQTFNRTSSNWPTETHIPDEIGVIADLQCGGWSTTILSADGKVYTVGSLDSTHGIHAGETSDQFYQLQYNGAQDAPIRSFSSGRRHILALTDSYQIISWDRLNSIGSRVLPQQGADFGGRPTRVVAGWEKSSAYIPDTGIVWWPMIRNENDIVAGSTDVVDDSRDVPEKIIPDTARKGQYPKVVEVMQHLVLEDFIVWITSESKLFAYDIRTGFQFPVPGYAAERRLFKDIQGQFRNFGVFTADGAVLAGNKAYLELCSTKIQSDPTILDTEDWVRLSDLLAARPNDVPALQHTGVISLAYGDHHYHALHANGRISSYGTDSQACGALGLGALPSGARFRGLAEAPGHWNRDLKLLPLAELRGRSLWFEPEKREWLASLEKESRSPGFGLGVDDVPTARFPREGSPEQQVMFSEWVEQEGRHWEDGPHKPSRGIQQQPSAQSTDHTSKMPAESSETDTYNHLSAYFGITIAAAGWHSGALVLVDDEKAELIRQKWIHDPASDEETDNNQTTSEKSSTQSQEQQQSFHDPIMMPGRFVPSTVVKKEALKPDEDDDRYVWSVAGFPKVELPDRTIVPGQGEVRPWRDGMPSLQELGLQGS